MRPDYFYVVKEIDDGPHNGLVKIGFSLDPIRRKDQYQTGNHRELVTILCVLGGAKLEKEFKKKFSQDKVGNGGDEWYKLTEDTMIWLFNTMKQSLIAAPKSDISFGGPIDIPKVELGETSAPLPRVGVSVSSVQPYEVIEAHPPKNPYSFVGRKKN